MRLGLLLVFGLFCLNATARSGQLDVLDAYYGADGRFCDVTDQARRACGGRDYCELESSNRLCGDPARGKVKSLIIAYSCGDGVRTIEVGENEWASAYCDNANRGQGRSYGRPQWSRGQSNNNQIQVPIVSRNRGIAVDYASYGTGKRDCDAARPVARRCDGQQECRVPADNDLCGDPDKGERKWLEVDYFCDGRPKNARGVEGSQLRLSCP